MSHDLQAAFDQQGLSEFRCSIQERAEKAKQRKQELEDVPTEEITVSDPSRCPKLHDFDSYEQKTKCYCTNMGPWFHEEGLKPIPFKRTYDLTPCFANKKARDMEERLIRLRRDSGLVAGNKRNSEYQHTFEQWKVTPANQELCTFLRAWNPHADEGIYIASLPSPTNPSGNGLGKSYALHALTNRLCADGVTCRFCRTSDFLLAIRDTYHSDNEIGELDILRQFSQVPVLLWDDLGKEAIRSEWGAEKFYQVIDDRCRQGLPVVISSNFLPDMIQVRFGANFGPAIVSRIAAMCPNIFQLAGDDQRFG